MKKPPNCDILNWDPERLESYWQQCREFDTRALSGFSRISEQKIARESEQLSKVKGNESASA